MVAEVKTSHFWRGVFGEFLGTMIFVFVSCGATLPLGGTIAVGDQSWVFGLAMTSVVQCVGYSTGGHINPAVTGAFVLTGKITWLRAFVYVVAQITGGIAGAGILYAVTPEKWRGKLGTNVLHDDVTAGQALGVEAVLTFLVVLTVCSATDTERKINDYGLSPLVIGLAYSAAHFMGIRYTGCSVNPARSFGPAVVMNEFEHQWIYWTGPMLAGITAGLVYESMIKTSVEARAYQLPPRVCNFNCCNVATRENVKEEAIAGGNYPTGGFTAAKYKKRDNEFDDILNFSNSGNVGGMYKI